MGHLFFAMTLCTGGLRQLPDHCSLFYLIKRSISIHLFFSFFGFLSLKPDPFSRAWLGLPTVFLGTGTWPHRNPLSLWYTTSHHLSLQRYFFPALLIFSSWPVLTHRSALPYHTTDNLWEDEGYYVLPQRQVKLNISKLPHGKGMSSRKRWLRHPSSGSDNS